MEEGLVIERCHAKGTIVGPKRDRKPRTDFKHGIDRLTFAF